MSIASVLSPHRACVATHALAFAGHCSGRLSHIVHGHSGVSHLDSELCRPRRRGDALHLLLRGGDCHLGRASSSTICAARRTTCRAAAIISSAPLGSRGRHCIEGRGSGGWLQRSGCHARTVPLRVLEAEGVPLVLAFSGAIAERCRRACRGLGSRGRSLRRHRHRRVTLSCKPLPTVSTPPASHPHKDGQPPARRMVRRQARKGLCQAAGQGPGARGQGCRRSPEERQLTASPAQISPAQISPAQMGIPSSDAQPGQMGIA